MFVTVAFVTGITETFAVGDEAPFDFDYEEKTEMFRIAVADSPKYMMIPRESVLYITSK